MKKHGFTLAEVLVTLTIIGVVAALTLPSLSTGIGTKKIGPALSTFASNFGTGVQLWMQENQTEKIESVNNGNANSEEVHTWLGRFSKYIKMVRLVNASGNPTQTWKMANGMTLTAQTASGTLKADQQSFGEPRMTIWVDITGESGPNLVGKDRFVFVLDAYGNLLPVGGSMIKSAYNSYSINAGNFSGGVNGTGGSNTNNCTPGSCLTSNTNACNGCAGKIADNGWSAVGVEGY